MTEPIVFISYSHKDEREKDRLLSHLRVLQSEGLISLWSDDRISVGADWESEIWAAMAQAKVAILLISADFLTSDFILGQEVPTLLKRRRSEGLTVFPVIAKDCAWQEVDWLTRMNVRPKNGRPIWGAGSRRVNEDLTAIAKEVAAIVKTDPPVASTANGVHEKSERAEESKLPVKQCLLVSGGVIVLMAFLAMGVCAIVLFLIGEPINPPISTPTTISAFPTDTILPLTDTPTPTDTPTYTPTETPGPTDTSIPTLTSTPTEIPEPTTTPTLIPTDTPIPTFTATSTNTPNPTPTESATPSGTVLAPGESLEQNGLVLTMSDYFYDVEQECIGMWFRIKNEGGHEIIVSGKARNFKAVDNLGRSWSLRKLSPSIYDKCDPTVNEDELTFSLAPNEELTTSQFFTIRGFIVGFTGYLTDRQVEYVDISVDDLSQITNARWRIPVHH
jgi:hypothetical protein